VQNVSFYLKVISFEPKNKRIEEASNSIELICCGQSCTSSSMLYNSSCSDINSYATVAKQSQSVSSVEKLIQQ
jgi:hypothetical protein